MRAFFLLVKHFEVGAVKKSVSSCLVEYHKHVLELNKDFLLLRPTSDLIWSESAHKSAVY